MSTLGFIGGGKMAEALISKLPNPRRTIVSDVSVTRLDQLRRRYRVQTVSDNLAVFVSSDVVVLAVKPQQIGEVLAGVGGWRPGVGEKKLIISIMAGIPLSYLQKKLPGCQIIRAMPNNPALVGAGITALSVGKGVTRNSLLATRNLFAKVGQVVEVPENLMDAVTGLSGSGPAFIYVVLEAMIKAGVDAGLPAPIAEQLAIQTVLGAATTLKLSGKSARELREMVTSPGGTTLEGLKMLEKGRFFHDLVGAVRAAERKAKSLSRQWTL